MADSAIIADLLKVSQLASRTSNAFITGKKVAPLEFTDVQAAMNELSKSLKVLAEVLSSNPLDELLDDGSVDTRDWLRKFLFSCRRTLQELNSLINEHQTTVKRNTASGWTVERTWSPMVLANHKYMMWTTQGGSLQTLVDLIQMHTRTFSLTTEAILSKSLRNLHMPLRSIADKALAVHRDLVPGDLSDRIDAVSQAITAVADGEDTDSNMDISQDSEIYECQTVSTTSLEELDDFPPPPVPPLKSTLRNLTQQSGLQSSAVGDIGPPRSNKRSNSSSPSQSSHRMGGLGGSISPSAVSLGKPPSMRSQVSSRSGFNTAMSMSPIGAEPLPPHLLATDRNSSIASIEMLPPAMVLGEEMGSETVLSRTMDELTLTPRVYPQAVRQANSKASAIQTYAFEKDAFKNSAILCDVRGAAVEYTRSLPKEVESHDNQDPFGVELVVAMGSCRIYIVKKRETLPTGEVHIATSIWAFSDDGNVRLQQTLEDGRQYIPYSSYFSPEKISLTITTELKYHGVVYGSRLVQLSSTNWINYVIEDQKAAAAFQNELMSRTLLATYKTETTLRVHEGFSGVLAYQEQMCGMENLRIWEDEVTQGVFCMIHYSAQFRPGYFAFWLNSSNNPVRIKDDGGREVKIKGLRLYLGDDPKGKSKASPELKRKDSASSARRGSDHKRYVTGAKIEFSSEIEKWSFLDNVRELQQTMIPLPDLI